jgi:chaperonin cofactor prefoldin
MKKKTEISEVWKLIMARMVGEILVRVIDKAWEEKFDNPKDYWENRIEILDQGLGEKIERGDKID